jgi:hypothetical protein
MQQFNGANIMTYYMPTLLQSPVGFSEERASLITACTIVPYVLDVGLAALLVERLQPLGLCCEKGRTRSGRTPLAWFSTRSYVRPFYILFLLMSVFPESSMFS